MKRLKKKLGTAWFVVLWVCCGLLLAAWAFFGLMNNARSADLSQQAAGRWENGDGENRFAQISAFFGAGSGFTIESVMQLRQNVDAKLLENSMAAEDENTRLWLDAYSATKALAVSSDRASAEVQATGVGGDFFFFHPYEMMSGQYLQPDDLLQDIVLIDWDLAWRLYGAWDVVGFPITVGGMPCYVGGVLRAEQDWPQSKTYGHTGRIFMSYDMLNSIDKELTVTCLELILPNPVSAFALGIAESVIPVEEASLILLENSDRYRLLTLLKGLGNFGMNGLQTKAIALPYWENAARIAESWSLLWLALAALMLLFPLVIFFVLLVKGWKRKGVVARKLISRFKTRGKNTRRKKLPEIQDDEPADSGEEEAAAGEEEGVHA